MNTPDIIVSKADARRLESLIASQPDDGSSTVAKLEAELARAELRAPESMPADVVTMNSQVVCVDESTGASRTLKLVYPPDADAAQGHVSVLAPVGAALLGLSVGQSIDWPLPNGRTTRLRVSEVPYQPESAGIYD